MDLSAASFLEITKEARYERPKSSVHCVRHELKLISENQSRETMGRTLPRSSFLYRLVWLTQSRPANVWMSEPRSVRPSNLSARLPPSLATGRALPHNAHLWHRSCRGPRCFPMDLAHHIRSSRVAFGQSVASFLSRISFREVSRELLPFASSGFQTVRLDLSNPGTDIGTRRSSWNDTEIVARVTIFFRVCVTIFFKGETSINFVAIDRKMYLGIKKKKKTYRSRNSLFEKVISYLAVERA